MDLSLLIFEGIGTQELILILVVALIVFGPRKLPQLARTFGKGMAEFKRASEDFKQQWEREVELEEVVKTEVYAGNTLVDSTVSRNHSLHAGEHFDDETNGKSSYESFEPIETPVPDMKEPEPSTVTNPHVNETTERTYEHARKRDWL